MNETLPFFNAASDTDLTLAVQQRYGAHLAQIGPNRIDRVRHRMVRRQIVSEAPVGPTCPIEKQRP